MAKGIKIKENEIGVNVTRRLNDLGIGDHIKFIRTIKYKGSRSRIELKCTKHGIVWSIEYRGLFDKSLCGCKKCAAEKTAESLRMGKDEFVRKARLVHGDKYDYSAVPENLKSTADYITIICPVHGPFSQVAAQHLLGHGCSKCFFDADRKRHLEKGERNFFKRAAELHNNKYDYSKVEYKDGLTKVCIICPIHGEFWQSPSRHLQSSPGCGCPKCARESTLSCNRLGEKVWRSRVDERIADLKTRGFDIEFLGFILSENEEYVTQKTKIQLKCNIHNVIWESNLSCFVHSDGVFCPECRKLPIMSAGERTSYLEVLKYKPLNNVYSNTTLYIPDNRLTNISKTILPDIYVKGDPEIIIEFDGPQHYEYEPYMQETQFDFIKQVRRDQFLETYCKENNIKLLRIPWKDENRIPEIIRSFLVDGKDITTKVYPKIPPVVIN